MKQKTSSETATQLQMSSSSSSPTPAPEDLTAASRDGGGGGGGEESITVERNGDFSAVCRWTVSNFPKVKARALWSKYFEVGGYDCRLLVYPRGDSQALPGYVSLYLQIMDPRGTCSSKWDCFASYRLAVLNQLDDSKALGRDSWHRFSTRKKSHGWCDFSPCSSIFDSRAGYLGEGEAVVIAAEVMILSESVSFMRDNKEAQSASAMSPSSSTTCDVLGGKFTWKVRNLSLFKEMIKTQKIISPVFPVGECDLRLSVYRSPVNGVDYLSICLESKDCEKTLGSDRSCWCLFRSSVLNQKQGLNHIHRDSYGRFAADNKCGDNTSLGWNDYMKISDFMDPNSGFLADDTAIFRTSFHLIKEYSCFSKIGGLSGGRSGSGARKSDGHMGRFTWRIENFTRLKDLLKKRKITGLCIKSKRFQIGNRDCRLIVYPRGQSQPPCHLSVFLEVTDSRTTSYDWSCFVSHRLSVVNHRTEDKSLTKESQNRYSKMAKDWGWREFITLTTLFDQESGFLAQDTVVFSAEVVILKEAFSIQNFSDKNSENDGVGPPIEPCKRSSLTWKVENFLSFKEIMETRKIFSKFFQVGKCEIRIGIYESFDAICIYLESEQSAGSDPDKNFWVKYSISILNQKNPEKTVSKESSICTKTWNNSVLQFMKVSDLLDADAGFLTRDSVVFVCDILDFCPWFEFSDLEVFASEDDQDCLTTDPDELVDSDDNETLSGDEEIFRNLLSSAGFHLTYGGNPSHPQITLREKLLMDAGAIAGFLTRLRVYLDDPVKVKRLFLPTKLSSSNDGKVLKTCDSSPSFMNLLMGVKALQQAIIDLLLDIMVECCQPSEGNSNGDSLETNPKTSLNMREVNSLSDSIRETVALDSFQMMRCERLDSDSLERNNDLAVQSSDERCIGIPEIPISGIHIHSSETLTTCDSKENAFLGYKTKWPDQSEELLGLIVSSLRTLDGAVPQGCPASRRRLHSAQKISLVLDKAPEHLQNDLVSLVPKLVDRSEHYIAASALLDRLRKPNAEPSLRIHVFSALSQLECSRDMWEGLLFQSLKFLTDSNDTALAATVNFLLKASTYCQKLPDAVRAIRVRLKDLGADVPSCILDLLCRIVNTCGDVIKIFVRDIDSDKELDDSVEYPHKFEFGVDDSFAPQKQQTFKLTTYQSCRHFSDIFILVEMLSIPNLVVQSSQTIERAVARGYIAVHSLAMVLKKRLTHKSSFRSRLVDESLQKTGETMENDEHKRVVIDDFASILSLAETFVLSGNPPVKNFAKILFIMLLRWSPDESHRGKVLRKLVIRATTCTMEKNQTETDFDILTFLVSEDQESVRPVLGMMREVAEMAVVNRDALWHQACASEEEINKIRQERKTDLSNMAKERNSLDQKVIELETINNGLKSELKAELDRFTMEKKHLYEKLREGDSQLQWIKRERDDEIEKLTSDKKLLQDRLYDAESILSQFKSRKRDELKRVMKEKSVVAERLRGAEAGMKRYEEEVKRYEGENGRREEVRHMLEEKVRWLTDTAEKREAEKRDKEEHVARCETYINGLESKLQACEQYIHTLEGSVQEEMSRHAPLYGVGLDALSLAELDTLSRIHEEGLIQIHTIQQQHQQQQQQRNGGSAVTANSHGHDIHPFSIQVEGIVPPSSSSYSSSVIPNAVGFGGSSGQLFPLLPSSSWFNHSSS